MKKRVGFNPERDVQAVEQFGFVDLVSALANNCIPSDAVGVDSKFNGIDEPGSIMNRARDVFDAAHLERTIRDYKQPATPSEENPA